MTLVNNGSGVRDFVHIDDVVEVILKWLVYNGVHKGVKLLNGMFAIALLLYSVVRASLFDHDFTILIKEKYENQEYIGGKSKWY